MLVPSFPNAQQAQIIRANQRDVFLVASLKEQSENILRSVLGTRWLVRWDKELDFVVKLIYFGFTAGRATQTLGEEYTNIWQYHSTHRKLPPPFGLRLALVLLPSLPHYILAKWNPTLHSSSLPPWFIRLVTVLPDALSIASEINLAIFYLSGAYYDVVKRTLRIQYLSSTAQDPHIRPPSYSLLGLMIMARLLHRLLAAIRTKKHTETTSSLEKTSTVDRQQMLLDGRPVSTLVNHTLSEADATRLAEEDEGTMLEVSAIPNSVRAGRSCTLCLEERTNTCSTECGHLFCWDCIFGWGREKAECPLCRQALDLKRLLPIYNL